MVTKAPKTTKAPKALTLLGDITASAKKRGYITQDEILAIFSKPEEHVEELDELYDKLMRLGYRSHRAPYEVMPEAYFALVFDPDGNMILLSA